MNETFEKEIKFISIEFNIEKGIHEQVVKTKTACFRELSRIDQRQNKLQWKIMEMMESSTENDESSAKINSAALCDLIYKYVKEMAQTNENFTEQDKIEFLNDNGAIMQFGLWALNEKIAPFFSTLMSN